MEDYGYKYFHNLPHFIVTVNSRNNRGINMKPNDIMNSDLMSIIYSKPLRENENLKFGLEERVRISEYDLPSGKVIEHTLHQKFLKLLPLLLKNLQHIQSKTNKKKFYEKEMIRIIWVWICLQSSWFPTHLCSSFQTIRSVRLQISSQSKWIWTKNGK